MEVLFQLIRTINTASAYSSKLDLYIKSIYFHSLIIYVNDLQAEGDVEIIKNKIIFEILSSYRCGVICVFIY